jgi:hypothetical protein
MDGIERVLAVHREVSLQETWDGLPKALRALKSKIVTNEKAPFPGPF